MFVSYLYDPHLDRAIISVINSDPVTEISLLLLLFVIALFSSSVFKRQAV